MKQRLEPKDLGELTEQQKVRLRELWKPQLGDAVLIPRGIKYGNGYGKWHEDIWDKDVVYFIGDIIADNISSVNNEPCLNLAEYSSDNYFEIMVKDCLPLLNIGQMIEVVDNGYFNANDIEIYELCDALWQAVKELL